jgi:2-C-methyl-D-erythritol 2,4-cyclodiphosphate synthase
MAESRVGIVTSGATRYDSRWLIVRYSVRTFPSIETGPFHVRVGIGHDTHRLSEGRPLILGGLRIEHPFGLLGHSDADVVCHAVADALLGAAGLGDIGEHYPDTDPQWRGLESTRLLAEVVGRVEHTGWRAVNCDVIIHAQEPKLGPHKQAIRANLARLLHVIETAVNVKAKTGEHVGPIGRGEAISCHAVVLLELSASG